MAGRRGHGEDGISFDHRGPCTDPERHRHCPGRWVGEAELPRTPDGKRNRRRVVGKTKTAVLDKLKELHKDLDKGIVPQTGFSGYTLREAAEDFLNTGLDGRSAKTIKKNENVLEPILVVIGAKRLRELTASDVQQALATMATRYSTAAVIMGHNALTRTIRHAEPGSCRPERRHPRRHTQRPGRTAKQEPHPRASRSAHGRIQRQPPAC